MPWNLERLERRHFLILKAEADAWTKAQQQAQAGGRRGH